MSDATETCSVLARKDFPTDREYVTWARAMLGIYEDVADTNICKAEHMLTDAMAMRELANSSLDRALVIAEALAKFLDSGTVGKYHADQDEPLSGA